ncbi:MULTISPECIES: flagellar basal body rod modification protein [unclassified Campylobacter]|uniref:flagellar basal body rod modification protein n=1 Tax=unclassified Campylobacter TaxID=2593542 RepID=UPI00147667D9|nr:MULTISPECIES: flagellar basal body rod modification protein [unclassified Campylobacter]
MAINTNNKIPTNEFTVDKLKAKKKADALAKADGTNPGAQLDKDAFMKLLLTELQYQDPTSPMDSEKMLTQTSQLATLETQENTNQMMKKLAEQLKASTSMYAVSALGKMATLGESSIIKEDGMSTITSMAFLEADGKTGTIKIKNTDGQVIRKIEFGNAKAGIMEFEWDGKDQSGNEVKAGVYGVEISYQDKDGKEYNSSIGKYPVEGIKFVNGEAQIKVGGLYVAMDKIREFTEPAKKEG